MPILLSLYLPRERLTVRHKKAKKLFHVTLAYDNNLTRTVKVKASTREVAEDRALKRNPSAKAVIPPRAS